MASKIRMFIASKMRALDETMTTRQLIARAGLNHSLFYRGTTGVCTLTEDQLDSLADALELDREGRTRLLSFRDADRADKYLTTERSRLMDDILFSEYYSHLRYGANPLYGFEYYDRSAADGYHDRDAAINVNLNERELAERMVEDGLGDNRGQLFHAFNVTVFNCVSEQMSKIIVTLLYSVENYIKTRRRESVRMPVTHCHNVPLDDQTPAERLRFYKRIMPYLSLLQDYNCVSKRFDRPVWADDMNDICIIDRSVFGVDGKPVGRKSYLLRLGRDFGLKAYVMAMYDRHQYNFFTVDSRKYMDGYNTYAVSGEIGRLTLFGSAYRKMTLLYDFCFDNLKPDIWLSFIKADGADGSGRLRVTDENSLRALELLSRFLEPEFGGAVGADGNSGSAERDPVDIALRAYDQIVRRYKSNNESEALNIVDMVGLSEFVRRGYIIDLDIILAGDDGVRSDEHARLGDYFKLSDEQMVGHLTEIYENLGESDGSGDKRQRYFIANQTISPSPRRERGGRKNAFSLFLNSSVATVSPYSMNSLDSVTFWNDRELVNLLFAYVEGLIKRRNACSDPDADGSGNVIMSDSDARAFVARLIDSVDPHGLIRRRRLSDQPNRDD